MTRTQLEAVRILHGEEKYKEACYAVCSERRRTDFKLAQVKAGQFKQKATLHELICTQKRLLSRNNKLLSSAKLSKLLPKPSAMKPKQANTSSSSSSSMDEGAAPRGENKGKCKGSI